MQPRPPPDRWAWLDDPWTVGVSPDGIVRLVSPPEAGGAGDAQAAHWPTPLILYWVDASLPPPPPPGTRVLPAALGWVEIGRHEPWAFLDERPASALPSAPPPVSVRWGRSRARQGRSAPAAGVARR